MLLLVVVEKTNEISVWELHRAQTGMGPVIKQHPLSMVKETHLNTNNRKLLTNYHPNFGLTSHFGLP